MGCLPNFVKDFLSGWQRQSKVPLLLMSKLNRWSYWGVSSVKQMREIREKLSEKYWQNQEALKKDIALIRKKYNFKTQENKEAS